MTSDLQMFNFRVSTDLKDKADAKCAVTRQSISSITTATFQKWLDDDFQF